MTDFTTWMLDNDGRLYRYWVYRRIWTPYEQEQKFTDESFFESEECEEGFLREAVELPDGDILLGFQPPFFNEGEYLEYYRLSEIHLVYSARGQREYEEDEDV